MSIVDRPLGDAKRQIVELRHMGIDEVHRAMWLRAIGEYVSQATPVVYAFHLMADVAIKGMVERLAPSGFPRRIDRDQPDC
jgi:hypothetical protein